MLFCLHALLELEANGANVHQLLTAAMGLGAEAGEFTEIVKKIFFQGKPYDEANVEHMKIELGDCHVVYCTSMYGTGCRY